MQGLLVEIRTFYSIAHLMCRYPMVCYNTKAETEKILREIKLEESEHRLVGITSYKCNQALISRRNKSFVFVFLVRIKVEIPNFEWTTLTEKSSGR